MLTITPIPALNDNYIWQISHPDHPEAWVVDPGASQPVIDHLQANGQTLAGILVTHHHYDHTDGIAELKARYGVQAYGAGDSAHTDITLADGDRLQVLETTFEVLAIPGHTLDHLAFYSPQTQTLFCGDTLFFAGCGRIFEGTPQQMFDSLQKLAVLPDETRVYPTHEYTQANLKFAQAVEPDNPHVLTAIRDTNTLRNSNLPTLPTTIRAEKCHNPFLRSHQPPVIAAAMEQSGSFVVDPVEVFATVRQWKDNF